MKNYWIIGLVLLLCTSCFKEDNFVLDNSVYTEELESDHETNGQIYYSLKERRVVAQNGIYEWDMAFDCRDKQFNIILNSAKGMAAFNSRYREFATKFEVQHYPWRYDHPCGDLNMTCIGRWGDFEFENPQSFSDVYIINLGVRGQKTPLGFRKLQIMGFEDSSYIFRFADLNGKNETVDTIKKDGLYNFVYYSFQDSGQQVWIEPYKDDWDIMFSPYMEENQNLGPYDIEINKDLAIFDGVSQNRFERKVAVDTGRTKDEINYFEMDRYEWGNYTNIIGSSWFDWNFIDSSYTIHQPRTFIIKNNTSYYLMEFESYDRSEQFLSRFRFKVKSL